MTTNDFDFLNLGEDLNELAMNAGGFRRIQHMNENYTYHAKTVIAAGGYAIKNEAGDAPVLKGGKTETIKHRGGNSTIMMCATQVELALIGWTDRYYVAEYDDPAFLGKRVQNIVNTYFEPGELPGANGKCRPGMTLFVALKDDHERQLWALDFRGFNVADAQKLIFSAKAFANDLAKVAKAKVVHPFVHWLTLGVGESKMVGKVEQSPISPPVWVTDANGVALKTVVTRDDYAKFIELRRELDTYLPTSRYVTRPAQPALAAVASAPALSAPKAQVIDNGDFAG